MERQPKVLRLEWRLGENVPPLDVKFAMKLARRTVALVAKRLVSHREGAEKLGFE